jgi:hypothetical protein
MNAAFYSFFVIFFLLTRVVGMPHQHNKENLDSKIELHAAYDLPPNVSTNTIIIIEKKENGPIRMNLVYEIYTEWDKPYRIDKQSNCAINDSQDYDLLWVSLLKEDVFELETIDFQGDDYLLYSSPPGIPSPVVYFNFSFGEKKKSYSCLDIEKIVGDKRYLNVLRLLKNFIEKHHCNQVVPDWLTRPLREKFIKKE